MEKHVSCGEEEKGTRPVTVKEDPASAFRVGGFGSLERPRDVEKDSRMTATGLELMAGLYRPEKKCECRLVDDNVNVVQINLGKDGSATKCGVQARLAGECAVVNSDEDKRRWRKPG